MRFTSKGFEIHKILGICGTVKDYVFVLKKFKMFFMHMYIGIWQ